MAEKISGIYKIECLVNGKVYIGQSVDINRRLRTHKSMLKNNNHKNNYLQRSWNKHSEENFTFEIIENCKENICEREIYWIDFYNSLKDGYNLTAGGLGGQLGSTWTEERKEHIRNKLYGKKLSKETKTKIKLSRIGKTLSTETKLKISMSLKDKYKNGEINMDNIKHYGKDNSKSVQVYQFDINTLKIINKFNCILDAEKYIGVIGINDCINKKQRSAGGFYWQRVDDTINDKYIGLKKRTTPNKSISVYQIDVNSGNIINTFDSIADANVFIGKPRKSGDISATCSGKQKTSGGYIWRYANKEI